MESEHIYSKNEIASFLREYTFMYWQATMGKNYRFGNIFANGVKVENGKYDKPDGYYSDMVSVFEFFAITKLMSSMKDSLFDDLKENDINAINIPEDIFVNRNDAKSFSKKQTIKYIRNALNHNDNEARDLFVLKKKDDTIKLEINLLNTNPKPFHVEMNMTQFFKLATEIKNACKLNIYNIVSKNPVNYDSPFIFNQILHDISVRKYYLTTKTRQDLKDSYNNAMTQGMNYLDENVRYRDFPFTQMQALAAFNDYTAWISTGKDKQSVLSYVLTQKIPLAETKIEEFMATIASIEAAVKNPNATIHDIENFAAEVYKNQRAPIYTSNGSRQRDNFYYCILDFDEQLAITMGIYAGYFFDSVIKDETVNIGSKVVSREKLRDAFVHSRWFCDGQGNINLFDWEYGDNNEFNPNWQDTFSVADIIGSVESYYEQEIKKETKVDFKTKHEFYIPEDKEKK